MRIEKSEQEKAKELWEAARLKAKKQVQIELSLKKKTLDIKQKLLLIYFWTAFWKQQNNPINLVSFLFV